MVANPPETNMARTGTPPLHARSLFVIHSGPVWPCNASVCRVLDAAYTQVMAQVNSQTTKTALMKYAKFGIPASTAAIIKTDLDPADCPWPLING